MAQCGKVEGQVEIRCNADKIFDLWTRNTLQLGKVCPSFPKIELVEGDNCHTPGAILKWSYICPVSRKCEYVDITVEETDEKKRSLIYKLIGGPLMRDYFKTWREKIEFIPKDDNCTIAKWSIIEYEKKCDDAPDVKIFLDFLLGCLKDSASMFNSSALEL